MKSGSVYLIPMYDDSRLRNVLGYFSAMKNGYRLFLVVVLATQEPSGVNKISALCAY